MKRKMSRQIVMAFALILCMYALAACKKEEETAAVQEPVEEEFYEYEEYPDDDDYYEEEEFVEEEGLDLPEENASEDKAGENAGPAGKWYTEDYDVDANWATSYVIDLSEDGKATCTGWRNKDTGTYTADGNKVTITFDDCQTDEAGEGWTPVKDFVYTINMEVNGDEAVITIDAPDVISNLEDGTLHRKSEDGKSGDGDEGEGSNIADGEYITDETYKGDISEDGSTLSIDTALYHYDKDWNTVLDYEKRTYVFSTSKDCKCVIYHEDMEEYPVAEQVEFINEFLKGNSGLPITFKIKGNELIEIGFSS